MLAAPVEGEDLARPAPGHGRDRQWPGIPGKCVENQGEGVAFMVHARVTQGKGGEDVTPIFWSDNYFSLLPGEKREVTATFDGSSLEGKQPVLEIEGYNVTPGSVQIGKPR